MKVTDSWLLVIAIALTVFIGCLIGIQLCDVRENPDEIEDLMIQ